MTVSSAHEQLAEKFMHRRYWKDVLVPDSMRSLVALAYTEEEAELVLALSFAPLPAAVVARRVRRPVSEVKPLLESMSERLLITGVTFKGVQTFGFLNFIPGVFEAQMIRAKTESHDDTQREFFVQFAALYEEFYDEILTWLKPNLDGKDLRFGRIIPIGKSVNSGSGVVPVATDSFEEMVDRNNSFCLVEACACRTEMALLGKGCDKPRDVCSAMGWLADFCIEKGLARRVSKQEFLDAKARATSAGLVHLADNLENPLQLCSCCSCCCSALRILGQYNIPTIIASSQYEALVDDDRCNACAKCSRACPMQAIEWKKKQPPVKVDYARCIGCGICVQACDREHAMSLRKRANHVPPSETVLDYYADRLTEIRGEHGVSLGPRITLGLGRVLSKMSPLSISGPGYKPG